MARTFRHAAAAILMAGMLFLTSACSEYVDLDQLVFITSILVDREEPDGSMSFYFETLSATRSSSKEANEEKRIVYKVVCGNAGDAINMLESYTSSQITLAHNKILLFTERFAQMGVADCFDVFDRRQSANARTLIGIFEGDTMDFMEPHNPEENITGLYLYEMLGSVDSFTSVGVRLEVREFMNQVLIGDKVNSAPVIKVSEEEDMEGHYYIDGLALIKNYQMIGRLSREDSFYFNLMLNNEVAGDITTANPQEPDKIVSMILLSDSYGCRLDYKDGVLAVNKTFTFKTNITSIQGSLPLSENNIKLLEEGMQNKIRERCMTLFTEWKVKKTDVFDIQEEFEREYPELREMNIIEIAEMKLDVKVIITGTATVMDSTN